LREWGADGVVTQYEIHDGDGRLVARVDVAVPEQRLALEYDSDRWHSARRYASDEHRQRQLNALGWRVEPVSKHDLLPSNDRIKGYLCSKISLV
jgi:very-short-patch-repair endonuclease